MILLFVLTTKYLSLDPSICSIKLNKRSTKKQSGYGIINIWLVSNIINIKSNFLILF